MIRGPVVFRMLDGGRIESTSPETQDVPFGAKGTELWFFDAQGDHYGTVVAPDHAYKLFPPLDPGMEPSMSTADPGPDPTIPPGPPPDIEPNMEPIVILIESMLYAINDDHLDEYIRIRRELAAAGYLVSISRCHKHHPDGGTPAHQDKT